MEGLRRQAQKLFDGSYFQPSLDVYQTITITSGSDLDSEFTYEESHESIKGAFADPFSNGTVVIQPVLKLMKFDKDHEIFHTTKEHLLKAIELCRIDPYMLYLLACRTRGFHCFQDEAGCLGYRSCYINNGAFVLMWTHDMVRCSTKGLIVRRQSFRAHEAYNEFLHQLHFYRSFAHDPLSLAFVSSFRLVLFVDRFIQEQRHAVRNVEIATTFSPWHLQREPRVGIERNHLIEISRMSQKMSAALSALAEIVHHSESIGRINRLILSNDETEWILHLPSQVQAFARTNRESIKEAVMILQSQIEFRRLDSELVQKRAQNQLGVLFNLMARSDTQATIELAESSKRDSTSMKTIAVMTMAFLPGTFFAALFAVPSLKWDSEPIIQPKFWIYWAFSMPFTALIFIVWAIVVKWKLVRKGFRKFFQTPNESKRLIVDAESAQEVRNPHSQRSGAHEKAN